ncbi:class I SAM-dependent methyltransferase [Patescibacteria group bacterium]|nr:class I SAM-dependent methyltransferase [Patescibacteria group bacterium]
MKINFEKLDHCLLCNSKNIYHFLDTKSVKEDDSYKFSLYKCKNCGFVFVNPRPSKNTIGKYYPEECPNFADKKINILDLFFNVIRKSGKKTQIRKFKDKKVLDIGFGSGDYLKKMYKDGWDCYGVDTSKYAYENLNKSHPEFHLVNKDLLESKFKSDYFDHVHMSAVLEHISQPLEVLKEVKRVLKKGGTIFIMVPNFDGLYYLLNRRKAEYLVPQHLLFFNKKTLKYILKIVGFSDVKVKTDFGNLTSYLILNKLGLIKNFYQKSVLRQFLGVFILPMEKLFDSGDVLIADVTK